MPNTSDLRIVQHDELTTLAYLPGSNTPLSRGASVITPDAGIGIVQAVYPNARVATVTIFPDMQYRERKEYPLTRLRNA